MADYDGQNIQVEEIEIKVPFGVIAAKWWGPRTVRPILAVHGWQDNAGTFDALIPLLPRHISFLAIDLPGHGLSSRLPNGMMYSFIEEMYILNFIIKQFQWEKVSFLAHSMGAVTCFVYTATFPDRVDMVISLDGLKPRILHPRFIDYILPGMEEIYLADRRNQEATEPPSYSYDEVLDKLSSQTYLSVTKDAAPHLLRRAIKPSINDPTKFYFTRDNRLKIYHFAMYTHEICLTMASAIKCPFLFIKALDSPYLDDKRYMDETVELMKKRQNFEVYYVDGAHHVHLTNPVPVGEIVTEFLNKHRPIESKL